MRDFTENIKNLKIEIVEILSFISNKKEFDRVQNILYYLDFRKEILQRIYILEDQRYLNWFQQGFNEKELELVFNLFTRIIDLFKNKEFEEVSVTPPYKELKEDIDIALSTLFM